MMIMSDEHIRRVRSKDRDSSVQTTTRDAQVQWNEAWDQSYLPLNDAGFLEKSFEAPAASAR